MITAFLSLRNRQLSNVQSKLLALAESETYGRDAMLRPILALALAGLIFMVSETAQAASIAPLTVGNAVAMGHMQDVSWRRCWHDRYGNKHCGRCWRDPEGRVHCS
jgi:hypothetical protein